MGHGTGISRHPTSSGKVRLRWRDRDGVQRSLTVPQAEVEQAEERVRDALAGRVSSDEPALAKLPPVGLSATERARLPRDVQVELAIIDLQVRLDGMTNGAAFVAGTRLLTQLTAELEELRRPPPPDPNAEVPFED